MLCSSESGFCRAPFQFDQFILGLFLWPLSEPSYCCYLVVLLRLAFHRAPFLSECFLLGLLDTLSTHIPSLLVSFGLLVFPRAPLFLLCCFGGVFHMCHRLWQGDCTRKQVVNRLKIPQGLSTLFFHRWSEVPSRGGVCDDSSYEKLPALQRCHMSVFSECFFLERLGWAFFCQNSFS